MHDPRNGVLIAALNHGHFGVKMHRSRDGGASWNEIATPKYPEKSADYVPKVPVEGGVVGGKLLVTGAADWSLKLVWALAYGGADEPGVLWCGTPPGGLFRSEDGGDSWSLNRALWDDPRREEWFGGGADHPGIHSVCVDRRDSAMATRALASQASVRQVRSSVANAIFRKLSAFSWAWARSPLASQSSAKADSISMRLYQSSTTLWRSICS
jgi:hypothetical protein